MRRWTLISLVVLIPAAVLGFAGVLGAAAGIVKLWFYVFFVLFAISLEVGQPASA
jgi:uncharacterized membrane protein YtjA (UPF0391 family)